MDIEELKDCLRNNFKLVVKVKPEHIIPGTYGSTSDGHVEVELKYIDPKTQYEEIVLSDKDYF